MQSCANNTFGSNLFSRMVLLHLNLTKSLDVLYCEIYGLFLVV